MLFVFCSTGDRDPESNYFTYGKSIILAFSSFILKGWNATPTKNAARIIFFV